MIIRKRSVLHALAISALVSTGAIGIATANAQDLGRGNGDRENTGTERGQHGSRHVDRETRCKDGLEQAVSDGKLTEAQKTLLLEKRDAIRAERKSDIDGWKSLTRSQQQEKMKSRRTELERFAKDNGIDMKYLFLGGGYGARGEFGNDGK
ncbi:MAG: hypothetical protein HGB34_04720 [Candidatus Moranbacteria bacterium]|nr:hypothetical protein [Candidatus Moranbacteria bacterium]